MENIPPQRHSAEDLKLDQVNVRLEAGLNDWLNACVLKVKRAQGKKINKELFISTLLSWFRTNEPDWTTIQNIDDLSAYLGGFKSANNC